MLSIPKIEVKRLEANFPNSIFYYGERQTMTQIAYGSFFLLAAGFWGPCIMCICGFQESEKGTERSGNRKRLGSSYVPQEKNLFLFGRVFCLGPGTLEVCSTEKTWGSNSKILFCGGNDVNEHKRKENNLSW